MNLNTLEKAVRQAIKGDTALFNKGLITPAEHKSLSSLSWQIAANVRADGSTYAYKKGGITDWGWM